ncbi:hypothetical protein O3P69_020549 [Scylla paramamosain]|uniref:Secreted protein n=1 Tax=Scylla paramamosain TaxID=85552 RepID=A0AAW0TQK2_SCYPA
MSVFIDVPSSSVLLLALTSRVLTSFLMFLYAGRDFLTDKPIKIYSLEGRQPAPTSGPSAPCAFTCGVPSPLSSSKSFSMSGRDFLTEDNVEIIRTFFFGPFLLGATRAEHHIAKPHPSRLSFSI